MTSTGQQSKAPPKSKARVIMHVDMDCFYAQVERERFPAWRGSAIAVVQNGQLCVTSNYRARCQVRCKQSIYYLFSSCVCRC